MHGEEIYNLLIALQGKAFKKIQSLRELTLDVYVKNWIKWIILFQFWHFIKKNVFTENLITLVAGSILSQHK